MKSSSGYVWMVALGILVGLATGFAVPLAASYEPQYSLYARRADAPVADILQIQPVPAENAHHNVDRDAQIATLTAENRRLLALLAALRQRRTSEITPATETPAVVRQP